MARFISTPTVLTQNNAQVVELLQLLKTKHKMYISNSDSEGLIELTGIPLYNLK